MKLLAVVVLLIGCDGTLPAPDAPAVARRLLADPSLTLIGHGPTTCSSGVARPGSEGAVWCAFARPDGDATELWVLDVSAAFGAPVACDGSSPRCRRLTRTLWTGVPLSNAPGYPGVDAFDGDTLVFYADTQTQDPQADYLGAIEAWRPGWTSPRVLTTPAGFICHGQPWAAAAYCVDGVTTVDQGHNFEFDLRAGALDGPGAHPLPSIGRIRALGQDGEKKWAASFSPDGQSFLYSAADATDAEVLRAARPTTSGFEPAIELVRGAARWQLAPDGRKVYYLADYGYTDQDPSGTLTMIDFPPTGAAPVPLQTNVGRYEPAGDYGQADRGLLFVHDLAQGTGTLGLMRDRARPASATNFGDHVLDYVAAPDLLHAWLQQSGAPSSGVLASSDGQSPCALGTYSDRPLVYSVAFSPDGGTVFFAQDAPNLADSEGWYADSASCARKRQFSGDLAYLLPVRDGLLYAEKDPGGLTMTLRHAPLDQGTLGRDVVIQPGIGVAVAQGGTKYIVYTVSSGDAAGLWAYGPL
jgi:hypothetical protein